MPNMCAPSAVFWGAHRALPRWLFSARGRSLSVPSAVFSARERSLNTHAAVSKTLPGPFSCKGALIERSLGPFLDRRCTNRGFPRPNRGMCFGAGVLIRGNRYVSGAHACYFLTWITVKGGTNPGNPFNVQRGGNIFPVPSLDTCRPPAGRRRPFHRLRFCNCLHLRCHVRAMQSTINGCKGLSNKCL